MRECEKMPCAHCECLLDYLMDGERKNHQIEQSATTAAETHEKSSVYTRCT